ncbi:MAG: hypothetical protein ACM3ZT_05045 [Bacillota bacterium]
MDEKTAKKNRLIILLLLAIFLAPALGSWLLYANMDKLHLGTTNHGEFVQPPRPLDLTGLTLPKDYFAHHFTLVYPGGVACGEECRHALTVMKNTQLALGEQMSQVQRLYLATGEPAADVTQGDPGLKGADVAGLPVLKGFDGADAPKYIYLVDTNGYVVLRYPLNGDPKWILQDLRHLLGAEG